MINYLEREHPLNKEKPLDPLVAIGGLEDDLTIYDGTLWLWLCFPRGQGFSHELEEKEKSLNEKGFYLLTSRTGPQNITFDALVVPFDQLLRGEALIGKIKETKPDASLKITGLKRDTLTIKIVEPKKETEQEAVSSAVSLNWDHSKGRWMVTVPGRGNRQTFLDYVEAENWQQRFIKARESLTIRVKSGDTDRPDRKIINQSRFMSFYEPAMKILGLDFTVLEDNFFEADDNRRPVALHLSEEPGRREKIMNFFSTLSSLITPAKN